MECVSAHHVKSVMSVSPKAVRGDLPSRLRAEALQREDAKSLRRRQGTPLAAFFNTPLLEKGKLITSAARVEDRENTEDRFPPLCRYQDSMKKARTYKERSMATAFMDFQKRMLKREDLRSQSECLKSEQPLS